MKDFALWGTIVNTVLVLIGALVGVAVGKLCRRFAGAGSAEKTGNKPTDSVMRAMGLCVILIGISGALKMANVLVVIVFLSRPATCISRGQLFIYGSSSSSALGISG